MNSCDKQTKWLIAIILVGSALIIGGAVGTYDAIDNTRETQKNETTIQKSQNQGDSAYLVDPIDSGLLPVTGQRQPWPDVGEGSCLLVNVPAPHNQPDKLTSNNTVRIPYGLCHVFIMTIQDLAREGWLTQDDLQFIPGKSF